MSDKTKTFSTRIKSKRDTSANWESANPVLLNGEKIIVDTAAGEVREKIGDGVKTYSQLPFTDEKIRGLITEKADEAELERLKYYGDKDIIPSPENYFTVNSTGETITGLTDTGKTQTELVIPYEINGKKITTLCSGSDGISGPPVSILDGNNTITKVVIPKSVTTLGGAAFANYKLSSIDIPNSVTTIGSYAFWGSLLTSINIPSGVISIGDYAFMSSSLTSINIPSGVISIGDYAFMVCSSLASVNIPNSVTSIGNGVFSDCIALTKIEIPDSIVSIESDAFYNCTNLTIYCEQGSYAETYAKANSISIVYTDMKATALDNKVDKVEGKSLIDENVANNLSSDTTTVRIKKGTELKTNGSEINGVRIDDNSVTVEDVKNDMSDPYIGYKNVMDKDGLHIYGVDPGGNQDTNERVDITSSGVKYSGAQGNGRTLKLGFEGAGFPQLTMDGNPGESKSVKIDFDDVIVQNESTTHKLSEKVDKVEGKSLIDTGVANNISYADNSGFKLGNNWSFGTGDITHTSPMGGAEDFKFAINSGLILTPSVGSGDFDITLVKGGKTHKLSEKLSTTHIANGETIGTIKIGRTGSQRADGPYSTIIGFGGHTDTNALGSVAIGNGECLANYTVAIGTTVASGDNQLVFGRYNVKDTENKYACIIGNGTSDTARSNAHTVDWNGNGWFAGDVEGVKNGVTHKLSEKANAGDVALLQYYGTTDIAISDSSYFTVNETGETITGLTDAGKTQTELVIPYKINGKKITTLFSGSTSGPPVSILNGSSTITKVVIPKSVTTLGRGAFFSCAHLIDINIPDSVTSIGDNAFHTCIGLTSINIPSSVTSIGINAFFGCSALTSVNIPNSVTSIGDSAFYDCMALTSINIPNSVTSIGDYTFYQCSALTKINIPNSVTSIGSNAFEDCNVLKSIDIPNGVTSIGDYTFYQCSALTKINIPNSVTSIGNGAFARCSSNFTIYCEQGSYADTYAKSNNISVVYTDVKDIVSSSDVLTKTNTTEFTPTSNYQPATKKYVDDAIKAAIEKYNTEAMALLGGDQL